MPSPRLSAAAMLPSAKFLRCFAQIALSPLLALNIYAADVGAKPKLVGGIEFFTASGLELEQAADSSIVNWPIVADWDNQGRLIVAESGGVAKPIEEHNKQLLHRIVRIEDHNGDGRFDARVVVADKLPFPEGVLCIENAILVSAPPQIWKLTDRDNDGLYEQREVWYDPGTITGCANDLHGPYMGRDGWIYWCKGAFAEQTHELTSGKKLTTKAAHIFRRRLDGGAVEAVMTGGMDNPVEMAMIPSGERFFTSTFLQHPAAGKRDGIAHALYGGVYGKDHQVIHSHRRTGDLLPIMTHLGPAAPSGLICLESTNLVQGLDDSKSLPAGDSLVAAQFNLHKVSGHRLVPRGASFDTRDLDLLRSEKIDFHPTDVIEDADGSLLVIDTGGWYNLCCPSSGIDQKVALGGIYRLSTPQSRSAKDPRGQQLDWKTPTDSELVSRLRSTHPWVVKQSANRLVHRADEVVETLSSGLDDPQAPLSMRQTALWTLGRIGSERALRAVANSLKNQTPSMRQTAAHILSVNRSTSFVSAIRSALESETNPAVKRSLCEAVGRIGDPQAVPILMSIATKASEDRALEHSAMFAMMEMEAYEQIAEYMGIDHSPAEQRVAIQVLDQSGGQSMLKAKALLSMLSSDRIPLRNACIEVLIRHPDWASQIVSELPGTFTTASTKEALRSSLTSLLSAWSSEPQISSFLSTKLDHASSLSMAEQSLLLDIFLASRSRALPNSSTPSLVSWLKNSPDEQKLRIARWIANANLGELDTQSRNAIAEALLAEAYATRKSSPNTSLLYLAALPMGSVLKIAGTDGKFDSNASQELETLILTHYFDSSEHSEDGASSSTGNASQLAASALERSSLGDTSSHALIERLDQVSPLRLMSAVQSIQRMGKDEIDILLLNRLKSIPAARTLPLDQVTALYRNRKPPVKSLANETIAELRKSPSDVEAKLDELLGRMQSGDVSRGFQIFRSSKAGCSACHRIGYVGGNIGPDLTRIGGTRSRRALLEAIVFPSARLEQSYQSTQILTVNGQVHSGLIARETPEMVELVTGLNRTVTIATEEVEKRQPSPVSIMPAGLDQQLTLEQLADLLTLLEAAR